jgi:hypothetical protein
VVEGKVMSKFGIQTLEQFCYKIWRNFESNQGTLKRFEPEHAYPRDVAPCRATLAPPSYTRAQADVGLRPPDRPCAVGTVRLR